MRVFEENACKLAHHSTLPTTVQVHSQNTRVEEPVEDNKPEQEAGITLDSTGAGTCHGLSGFDV